MHVRLLGSLEIETVGRVISVGGQQRRILLSLALEPHGLHREVLEERLGLSRGGLRTSVTRLRSTVGSEAIESIENGYRLRADSIDADRFELLVRDADAARGDARVEALTEALAIWRGDALQDVAEEDWARPTAVRLAELRVAASEDLAEALIDADRTTEAITRLRVLATDHPYRDRACGLLMTALTMEGRQTEALRAFQEHRERLIDEVGIDPSDELVDLDRRIAIGEAIVPIRAAVGLEPDDGLLTFVFTDIVGSTARWNADAEEMAAALMRHDAAIEAAVTRAGGRVVKHTGDGFMAVFAEAEEAVAAAVAAQRTVELPIRIGMHLGTASARDGDYFGPAVNRAARIMSVAHGGQILLSPEVDMYLSESETLDLGRHRLRAELEPEQLMQLVHPELASSFPELRGALETPHNLPSYPSDFIGRTEDVSALASLLRNNRMTSVVGVGGAGKTRLAIAAASTLLAEFPNGVYFIELASLTRGQSICAAIRSALGLAEGATTDQQDARDLGALLRERRTLLVLDNCEHLGTAPALVAEQLLLDAPALHVLATSRSPLEVAAEALWNISGLTPADAAGLFEARAKAIDPALEPSDNERAVVLDICERLDHLPLAVELAAAQVALLSIDEIQERLVNVVELRNARASVAGRQETLRATLTWSVDSLSDSARRRLTALSVFAGQFSLDAAEAVAVFDGDDGADLVADLGELIQRGLLARDRATRRYRLLHLVRTFASESLTGPALIEARGRHAQFYTGHASALTNDIYSAGATADASDLANLRSAASHLSETANAAGLVGLIVAGAEYWSHAGAAHDIERWLQAATDMGHDLPVDLQVAALATVTSALTIARPSGGTAIELGLDAVQLAERPDASPRSKFMAACELGYAYVHADARDPRGPEWLNRSLEVSDNNPLRMMRSYSRLSVAAFIGGHPENGLEPAERAVAIAQAAGVTVFEQVARSFRAATRAVLGDHDGACNDLGRLDDVPADLDPVWRSTIHVTAANAWLALDDQDRARGHLVPALGMPLADLGEVIWTMIGSTACMLDVAPPEIVARSIGAIRLFHSATQPMLEEQLAAAETRVRGVLGDEAYAIAEALGARESIGSTNLQLANALADLGDRQALRLAS